ncbi:24500_t:CDS:2, partial [Dentiscutata erythropus]
CWCNKNDNGKHDNFTLGNHHIASVEPYEAETDNIETQRIDSRQAYIDARDFFYDEEREQEITDALTNNVSGKNVMHLTQNRMIILNLNKKKKLSFSMNGFVGSSVKEFTFNENDNKKTGAPLNITDMRREEAVKSYIQQQEPYS